MKKNFFFDISRNSDACKKWNKIVEKFLKRDKFGFFFFKWIFLEQLSIKDK